jgi:DNA-binding protein
MQFFKNQLKNLKVDGIQLNTSENDEFKKINLDPSKSEDISKYIDVDQVVKNRAELEAELEKAKLKKDELEKTELKNPFKKGVPVIYPLKNILKNINPESEKKQ